MLWTRGFAFASIIAFTACAGPQLPNPAGEREVDLTRLPPGAEVIAIPVATDDPITGIWVGGEPGAPVVLQFLDDGPWDAPLFWQLRDLGFGVLAVAGQAGSIAAADAAYAEAGMRAGAQNNVVLRGGTLGTIAIATLLEHGQHPGAVVLGAPALDDSRLVDALAQYKGRKLAFLAGADETVDADEFDALAAAVQASGGRVVVDPQATHDDVLRRTHSLLAAEQTLYAMAFPGRVALTGDLFQRRVIDSPVVAYALARALGSNDAQGTGDAFEESLVLRWVRRLPPTFADAYPDDALRALFDFGDPLGRLDPRELDWMGDVVQEVAASRGATALPEALLAHITAHDLERQSRYAIRHAWSQEPIVEVECDLAQGPPPWGAPGRLNLDPANSRRQLLRLALKAAGLPDRVAFDERSTPIVEVFDGAAWRRVR